MRRFSGLQRGNIRSVKQSNLRISIICILLQPMIEIAGTFYPIFVIYLPAPAHPILKNRSITNGGKIMNPRKHLPFRLILKLLRDSASA